MANWFLFSMFTRSFKTGSIKTSLGKLHVATHSLHYAILEPHVHVGEGCNTSLMSVNPSKLHFATLCSSLCSLQSFRSSSVLFSLSDQALFSSVFQIKLCSLQSFRSSSVLFSLSDQALFSPVFQIKLCSLQSFRSCLYMCLACVRLTLHMHVPVYTYLYFQDAMLVTSKSVSLYL